MTATTLTYIAGSIQTDLCMQECTSVTGNPMNLSLTGVLLTTRCKTEPRSIVGKKRRVILRVFEGVKSIPSLRTPKF